MMCPNCNAPEQRGRFCSACGNSLNQGPAAGKIPEQIAGEKVDDRGLIVLRVAVGIKRSLPNNVLDFTYRLQVKVLETHFTKLEHHLGHYAQAAVASESSQTIRRANGAEAFEASLVSIDESGNYRMTITAGPGY